METVAITMRVRCMIPGAGLVVQNLRRCVGSEHFMGLLVNPIEERCDLLSEPNLVIHHSSNSTRFVNGLTNRCTYRRK